MLGQEVMVGQAEVGVTVRTVEREAQAEPSQCRSR